MSHTVTPPLSWSGQLLQWALPNELKEPILGDLEEEFLERSQVNPVMAKRWYRQQALRSAFQFLWKTKRGLMMFLLSLIVYLGMTLMALMWAGGVDLFIDVPSAMMVILPSILFAIGATSSKSLTSAVNALFNEEVQFDKAELLNAQLSFKVMGQMALLTGVLGSLIGAIAIASHIDSEELSTVLGPALAVCFLCISYGFGLKILSYVAEQKLQFKLNQLV
jgi:chemotaxis protein MotA